MPKQKDILKRILELKKTGKHRYYGQAEDELKKEAALKRRRMFY